MIRRPPRSPRTDTLFPDTTPSRSPPANPARVTRQLVGIARPDYAPVYAEALHRLGTEHSRVISGDEGLDELSLAGGNEVAVVTPEGVRMQRSIAADAGLPTRPPADIRDRKGVG